MIAHPGNFLAASFAIPIEPKRAHQASILGSISALSHRKGFLLTMWIINIQIGIIIAEDMVLNSQSA